MAEQASRIRLNKGSFLLLPIFGDWFLKTSLAAILLQDPLRIPLILLVFLGHLIGQPGLDGWWMRLGTRRGPLVVTILLMLANAIAFWAIHWITGYPQLAIFAIAAFIIGPAVPTFSVAGSAYREASATAEHEAIQDSQFMKNTAMAIAFLMAFTRIDTLSISLALNIVLVPTIAFVASASRRLSDPYANQISSSEHNSSLRSLKVFLNGSIGLVIMLTAIAGIVVLLSLISGGTIDRCLIVSRATLHILSALSSLLVIIYTLFSWSTYEKRDEPSRKVIECPGRLALLIAIMISLGIGAELTGGEQRTLKSMHAIWQQTLRVLGDR